MQPADWQERRNAVDIKRSFIVQAPAGSGKTELLVQRILTLLAVADSPEEILSITFTRKAAGEMKLRLLKALESAGNDQPPDTPHAVETWKRARAVLARDEEKGWSLLQNPSRLQLMTIDSFCAFITRRMPWLARFGDQPGVTDDPAELYRLAAEALLAKLEEDGAVRGAVERLLIHLDNRLTLLREMLVAMLGRRDQWLRHLMTQRGKQPRQLLESGLQLYVTSFLKDAYSVLGDDDYCELRELANFAAANLDAGQADHPFAPLFYEKDDADSLPQWQALASLALTASGDVRKTVNKTIGFPADKSPLSQEMKSRALNLFNRFRDDGAATEALQGVRRLPTTCYSSEQWLVLQSLIELLPLVVVELQGIFRLHGQVDFIEIAGAAHAALGSVTQPEELLLQLDSRIRHILVDEFQDTSYAQYDLLCCLTAGWQPGDGRTLFVVGDPMQSIYRFREAEVGLYLRVCERGLEDLSMQRIVLNTNFRSRKRLVDWANNNFSELFPAFEDEVRGAVRFAPAKAFDQDENGAEITAHCFLNRQDSAEAQTVVDLVRRSRKNHADGTVAILVRSRSHLSEIVAALKKSAMRFQSQDIDPLIDRPVVQDLLSLTRALRHPADRVAWLAVLRAPWCGLTLDDLTKLCDSDAQSTVWQLLTQPDEQVEMFDQVSQDGRQRLQRLMPVLERALTNRGRLSLRHLVESTWLALGGPACVEEADLLDVKQVFALLDELENEGTLEDLERQLSKLYAAPDPQAGPELQLMTIHKAKGLEFDTVILPGLGRGVRTRERALLRWLEHPDYELLLAPIPPLLSDQQDPTYQAIGHLLQEKDDLETVRLLYVAATRAKSNLHLLGHVKRNQKDELVPLSGSLLSVAWPAFGHKFLKNIMTTVDEARHEMPSLTLKRLPREWVAPKLAGKLNVKTSSVQLASESGHVQTETVESFRTEEGRVIGTLIHLWLERIANEGLSRWTEAGIIAQVGIFKTQLNKHGLPLSRLEPGSSMILSCLIKTLASKRGRWLLDCHRNAVSELALNGMVDGKFIHATIDRTFIDSDGIRWLVDYKTSSPASGEEPGQFMAHAADRYRNQLQVYTALFKQLEPNQALRSALYFPAFDGWIEVDTHLELQNGHS
ncbi:MAG: UvrD-helicase domain-containing protein [Desulfuromonadales bacterium]|nr:UvrD-helicase domain-containing protein [Desulfuromonadales bacterium]